MKSIFYLIALLSFQINCSNPQSQNQQSTAPEIEQKGGQEAVQDDESQKDIVKIAVGSADHTTLVAALKAADYVDDLSNAGPFTVFAPTNDAFGKLPPGTVENLVKPEQKTALQNILEYHVAVGVFRQDYLNSGQTIGMVNGNNITIKIEGEKITVNDNINVIATIPAANGLIYVVDGVLLPPSK